MMKKNLFIESVKEEMNMSKSILVTTPKSEMKNSEMEAQNCIKNKGGYYFRKFSKLPRFGIGSRIYYVEDGYIRGFAEICKMVDMSLAKQSAQSGSKSAKENLGFVCQITGKDWEDGYYAFMKAKSWKWIKPIKMTGFQGYRYFDDSDVEIVGDWLDVKPKV